MTPVSGLVGRAAELAELGALIGPGRLVTVSGPGGVGKTSLARALIEARPDVVRIVFVDLSAVEDGDGVKPAVASALGVFGFDAIGAELVADGSVIIVDNCEHVLDAAAHAVSELRASLPTVSICVTSRIPLGLRDEHVLSLRPLEVPANDLVDAHAPAVELFLAIAERADGMVTEDDLAEVCELCRRIDGMPLAIEIIATRTRSMSVREILARLGDRLDTLGQGGFRRDDRQRTVRDTVEWSYRLLSAGTRRLFDRLGVFAGQFSTAMAHAVAAEGSFDETADGLDALVAASLLVASPDAGATTWYHQLHAVRVCARDHLDSDGELIPASERFVDHMVAEHDCSPSTRAPERPPPQCLLRRPPTVGRRAHRRKDGAGTLGRRFSAAQRAPPAQGRRRLPLHGADRELLVPDPDWRGELGPPQVEPGALLGEGVVAGTRADPLSRTTPGHRPSAIDRETVELEAHTFPLQISRADLRPVGGDVTSAPIGFVSRPAPASVVHHPAVRGTRMRVCDEGRDPHARVRAWHGGAVRAAGSSGFRARDATTGHVHISTERDRQRGYRRCLRC